MFSFASKTIDYQMNIPPIKNMQLTLNPMYFNVIMVAVISYIFSVKKNVISINSVNIIAKHQQNKNPVIIKNGVE